MHEVQQWHVPPSRYVTNAHRVIEKMVCWFSTRIFKRIKASTVAVYFKFIKKWFIL